MLELIKFIPFIRNIDSNDYSIYLSSFVELDEEENKSQPLRKKDYNFLFGKEKLISSEEGENLSDNS